MYKIMIFIIDHKYSEIYIKADATLKIIH